MLLESIILSIPIILLSLISNFKNLSGNPILNVWVFCLALIALTFFVSKYFKGWLLAVLILKMVISVGENDDEKLKSTSSWVKNSILVWAWGAKVEFSLIVKAYLQSGPLVVAGIVWLISKSTEDAFVTFGLYPKV